MLAHFSRTASSMRTALVLLGMMLSGCATPAGEPGPPSRSSPVTGRTVEPAPRAVASMRLTERARLHWEADRPDEAIQVLERAVNLEGNGRAYLLMAEAWLLKGDLDRARAYNRLAGIHPAREDPSWSERVRRQKEKIDSTPDPNGV